MTTFKASFVLNRRVVFALMMRELKTRFGEYHLGYAWAILEPLAHVAILSFMFSTIRQRQFYGHIEAPVFVILGIIPFFLYRNVLTKCMDAIKSNQGLFDHRQVKPLDTILARTIIEIVIHVVTFTLFLMGCSWLGYIVPMPNILEVIGIFILLSILSFNAGLLAAVCGTIYKETRKFIRVTQRPMYFISGVFFTIEMLPEEARIYLLWNPLLHALDFLKDAFIPTYDSPASWEYLIGFTISTTILALTAYRASLSRLMRPHD